MISVFLPVEDYYLNYESKVENSFVNAIPPPKKVCPFPQRNTPSPPAPIPINFPAKLPPISQPLPLAILRKAPDLSLQRRGPSPTSLPSAPKGNSPIRSSISARQYPSEAESTTSPPSQRSASIYSNDPPQNLTNSPPFGPLQNEQNERRKHPPLYPPTNAPFLWVLPPHLRAYSKPSFSTPQNNPTVGRRKNLL